MFKKALISIFITCTAVAVSAQTPKPTPPPVDDGEVIKVESRLVVVPVSVTDPAGQPVLGLKAPDFFISEQNRPQEIVQVSDAEKVPLEIALLFDISASTDPMFKFEQETAAKFLQEVMRPVDRATIFTIGERPLLIQSRGQADQAAITVKAIQPTKQQTAFYDSVAAAADYLMKNSPSGSRRVVVVISDGDDTNSAGVIKAIFDAERRLVRGDIPNNKLREIRVKARDDAKAREQQKVLRALQNADAVFYSVNPAGGSVQFNVASQFGQSNLEKFAIETGGAAFLPKFQSVDLKDGVQNEYNQRRNQETLTNIFRQLANELQAQYLVQYYSDADFNPGQYVGLKVGLQNPRNLRLRARQGYFVK